MPDKETKHNATGHGQAQLHDNGQIFRPISVFFIVEQTMLPSRFVDRLSPARRIWPDGMVHEIEKIAATAGMMSAYRYQRNLGHRCLRLFTDPSKGVRGSNFGTAAEITKTIEHCQAA